MKVDILKKSQGLWKKLLGSQHCDLNNVYFSKEGNFVDDVSVLMNGWKRRL